MTDTADAILAETTFTGDLAIDGQRFPITFRVSASADCRLIFDLDPVSRRIYHVVVNSMGEPGTSSDEFSLTGTSPERKTFHSDGVSVDSHRSGSDGHRISISARAATLTLPLDKPAPKPFLRLWFRAFKAFGNSSIDTKLGMLAVQGQVRGVGADDMSGSVGLQAHTDDPGANWREEADAFLRHMHQGLAFAHGGRLQTPRLDYIHGAVWKATFYDGRGLAPELSVQHPLNQKPYIEALVARYEKDGPLPEILWTAIGWMQIDTTFDEVRFLTAMTALETIVQHELPELRGTVILKADYRILRDKLKAVINDDETLTEAACAIFCGKINQNNQKTLSQKIDALFDHYDLPRQDFEDDVIRNLINLRNDIIHSGVIPNEVNIWPQLILVRELITRILLREIGYVGRYECYVGGYRTRDFPALSKHTEIAAP